MKKIINKVENYVSDMIEGFCLANSKTHKSIGNVILKKEINKNKVSLISGGGSGHEPAHAGYVGEGMLDAAVCGEVFTSPTPDAILDAIKATKSNKGTLLIVKNYTGDNLNFDMAKDLASADGIECETVSVHDDVALENSEYSVGRRGIAGTIFVHKIAGAKAASGASLKDVKNVAQKVSDNIASMGICLNPCTVPANGKSGFTLQDDEIEVGLGIHGEKGTHREKIKSAKEMVSTILDKIVAEKKFSKGCEVAMIVNGLGGTPLSELFIANKEANKYLKNKGFTIYKTFVGNFMTSLEMEGFSISLLILDNELKPLLDAFADAPAFKEYHAK